MSNEIEMGKEYRDLITGFIGICTGHCQYLSGCDQSLLSPKVDDGGGYREGHWFDSQRLQPTENDNQVVLDNSETPGHDKPAPVR